MNPFSINNKAPQPKLLRRFYRAVALTLCVCMLVTDVAQAAPEIRGSWIVNSESKKTKTQKTESNLLITIPKTLGVVEESYSSPRSTIHDSRPTVYYIQDAHDSLEAQENIAKIIKYLVKHNGVKTVFEEGYEGPVPTDKYFAGITDPEVKRKVAESLMGKMLIGGAEFAHITRFDEVKGKRVKGKDKKGRPESVNESNPFTFPLFPFPSSSGDFQLIGADNVRLHLENIEWYRQAALTRNATDTDLQDLAARLQVLAERELPKEVKAWMKLRKRFDSGELDLVEYLKRLSVMHSVGAGSPPKADPPGADKPALAIAANQGRVMNPPLQGALFPNIFTVLQAEQTRTPESLKAVQNIPHRELFSEIDRLENEFAQQTLQNLKHQTIFHYGKILNQLLRLSALEISFEEYEAIQSVLKTFETEELLTFIAHETHRSLALSKKWETDIHRAMRFYELAEERDKAVEKTLMAFYKPTDKTIVLTHDPRPTTHDQSAVLVFGGFHKENIKEILRRNGFSYVVIAPKISKINAKDRALYQKLMGRGVPGFSLPALARMATRYAPIFEIGEFLGQQKRVEALIQSEARKVAARSEVRKPRKKKTVPNPTLQAALDTVKHDARFQVVETENAVYVIDHWRRLAGGRADAGILSFVDAVAVTKRQAVFLADAAKPGSKSGRLIWNDGGQAPSKPLLLVGRSEGLTKEGWVQRFFKNVYLLKPIYEMTAPLRRVLRLLFETAYTRLALPVLALTIFSLLEAAHGGGFFAVVLFVLMIPWGSLYVPSEHKNFFSTLSLVSFFTPGFGLNNAEVGHKLEDFSAPKLKKELGRKPLIWVDVDSQNYGPLAAYLKSAVLRRRVLGFHRWLGFLFAPRAAAVHMVGVIRDRRVGAQDVLLNKGGEIQSLRYYHRYSFVPAGNRGKKKPVVKKKEIFWQVKTVRALMPLLSWLPKPVRVTRNITQEAIIGEYVPEKMSLEQLESKISKARPNSQDAVLRWLVLLGQWRGQVTGQPSKLQFDADFHANTERIVAQFLIEKMSKTDAIESLSKISAQGLGLKRAVFVLRKPLQYFLEQYQASVQERFFSPLEQAVTQPSQTSSPQRLSRFLQSDAAKLPLATPFWMILGSFISGATLGVVFGFIIHNILRPMYERILFGLGGQKQNPIRPQALLSLRSEASWDDVRLAYQEILSRSLSGENLAFEVRLRIFKTLVQKMGSAPEFEALIEDVERFLERETIFLWPKFWDHLQEKRKQRGISEQSPGFIFLSEILLMPKARPKDAYEWRRTKAVLAAAMIGWNLLWNETGQVRSPIDKTSAGAIETKEPVVHGQERRSVKLTLGQSLRIYFWQILKAAGWQEEEMPGFLKRTTQQNWLNTTAVLSKQKDVPQSGRWFQQLGSFFSTAGEMAKLVRYGVLYLEVPLIAFIGASIFQLRNTARWISGAARRKAAQEGSAAVFFVAKVFKESVAPRDWTENNPVFQTAQNEKLSAELLDYLEQLNIPEIEPLIHQARQTLYFKFDYYGNRTWYPFSPYRLKIKKDWGPLPIRNTELDLQSHTLVLNAKWPLFLKAIVFLHLAPYLFQHKVIPGTRKNIHLPSDALLAVRKKIIWKIGSKLFKDELAQFFNRPKPFTPPAFVHLLMILPAFLSTTVYSNVNRPGVLYQRTYDLGTRGFIKAREGFVIGAYQLAELILRRPVMIVTDQTVYPYVPVSGKATTGLSRFFGLIKPLIPAVKQIAGATVYLLGFIGIFGGLFLSLDLSFLEPLWSVIVDVFSKLPGVGEFFAWMFGLITASYFYFKEGLGAVLSWFGVDWAWVRELFHGLWNWLLPLRDWVRMVLMPFIYRWAIPVFLFGVGMMNGYIVYKVDLRERMQQGAQAVFSFGLRVLAQTPFILKSVVEGVLTGIAEGSSGGRGEAFAEWIENVRVVQVFKNKILPFLVNAFYAVLSVGTIAFYIIPLSLLAYPPAEFQMVFHVIHSLGVPLPPIVAVYLIAAFVGIPYSYFYILHSWLLRQSFFKKRPASAKKLFLGMTTLLGTATVLFPVGFSWFYRTNPLGLTRISDEKDRYIDQLHWGVREGYRGVGSFVEVEDERLSLFAREELEKAVEEGSDTQNPLSRELSAQLKKELSKDGKMGSAETVYRFVGRILPEDFKGFEGVIHSRTGYPLHPYALKPRAQEILQRLKNKDKAVYGNSFFFSDFLRHNAYPLRSLRETFGDAGAEQILSHLLDILEGKVFYPSYPETYSAQREALRAMRQFYSVGFGQQIFFPVTPEDHKKREQEADRRYSQDKHGKLMYFPSGTFYLRAADWSRQDRETLQPILERFLTLRSQDRDLDLYLRKNQRVLTDDVKALEFLSDPDRNIQNQEMAKIFWKSFLEQPQLMAHLVRDLNRYTHSQGSLESLSLAGRTVRLDIRAFMTLILEGSADPQAGQKMIESYMTLFKEANIGTADIRNLLLDQWVWTVLTSKAPPEPAVSELIHLPSVRRDHQIETYFQTTDFDFEASQLKEKFAVLLGQVLKNEYGQAEAGIREENNAYWLKLVFSHEAIARTQPEFVRKLIQDLETAIQKEPEPTPAQKSLKERGDAWLQSTNVKKKTRSEMRTQSVKPLDTFLNQQEKLWRQNAPVPLQSWQISAMKGFWQQRYTGQLNRKKSLHRAAVILGAAWVTAVVVFMSGFPFAAGVVVMVPLMVFGPAVMEIVNEGAVRLGMRFLPRAGDQNWQASYYYKDGLLFMAKTGFIANAKALSRVLFAPYLVHLFFALSYSVILTRLFAALPGGFAQFPILIPVSMVSVTLWMAHHAVVINDKNFKMFSTFDFSQMRARLRFVEQVRQKAEDSRLFEHVVGVGGFFPAFEKKDSAIVPVDAANVKDPYSFYLLVEEKNGQPAVYRIQIRSKDEAVETAPKFLYEAHGFNKTQPPIPFLIPGKKDTELTEALAGVQYDVDAYRMNMPEALLTPLRSEVRDVSVTQIVSQQRIWKPSFSSRTSFPDQSAAGTPTRNFLSDMKGSVFGVSGDFSRVMKSGPDMILSQLGIFFQNPVKRAAGLQEFKDQINHDSGGLVVDPETGFAMADFRVNGNIFVQGRAHKQSENSISSLVRQFSGGDEIFGRGSDIDQSKKRSLSRRAKVTQRVQSTWEFYSSFSLLFEGYNKTLAMARVITARPRIVFIHGLNSAKNLLAKPAAIVRYITLASMPAVNVLLDSPKKGFAGFVIIGVYLISNSSAIQGRESQTTQSRRDSSQAETIWRGRPAYHIRSLTMEWLKRMHRKAAYVFHTYPPFSQRLINQLDVFIIGVPLWAEQKLTRDFIINQYIISEISIRGGSRAHSEVPLKRSSKTLRDSRRSARSEVRVFIEDLVRQQFVTAGVPFRDEHLETRVGVFRPTLSGLIEPLTQYAQSAKPIRIIDMGSGQGAMVFAFARANEQAEVLGIEYDEMLYKESVQVHESFFEPVRKRIRLERGDFNAPQFAEDIQKADLINYWETGTGAEQTLLRTLAAHMRPDEKFLVTKNSGRFIQAIIATGYFDLVEENKSQGIFLFKRNAKNYQSPDEKTETRSEVKSRFSDEQVSEVVRKIQAAVVKVEASSLATAIRESVTLALKTALTKAEAGDRVGTYTELLLARKQILLGQGKSIGSARNAIDKIVNRIYHMPHEAASAKSEVLNDTPDKETSLELPPTDWNRRYTLGHKILGLRYEKMKWWDYVRMLYAKPGTGWQAIYQIVVTGHVQILAVYILEYIETLIAGYPIESSNHSGLWGLLGGLVGFVFGFGVVQLKRTWIVEREIQGYEQKMMKALGLQSLADSFENGTREITAVSDIAVNFLPWFALDQEKPVSRLARWIYPHLPAARLYPLLRITAQAYINAGLTLPLSLVGAFKVTKEQDLRMIRQWGSGFGLFAPSERAKAQERIQETDVFLAGAEKALEQQKRHMTHQRDLFLSKINAANNHQGKPVSEKQLFKKLTELIELDQGEIFISLEDFLWPLWKAYYNDRPRPVQLLGLKRILGASVEVSPSKASGYRQLLDRESQANEIAVKVDLTKTPNEQSVIDPRGIELTQIREQDPELYNLLFNADNAKSLLAYLTRLRGFFYDYKTGFYDRRPPLQYALQRGLYFHLAGDLYVTPSTQSFRRHVIFRMTDAGVLKHAVEIKIPGDWRFRVSEKSLPFTEAVRKLDPDVIVPALGFVKFDSAGFELYGKAVDPSKESMVPMSVFGYVGLGFGDHDGFRVRNLSPDHLTDWALMYPRYRGDVAKVSKAIAEKILRFTAAAHTLRFFSLPMPPVSDLHTENFRLIPGARDFKIEQVGDMESFIEMEAIGEREIRDDLDVLVNSEQHFPLKQLPGLEKFSLQDARVIYDRERRKYLARVTQTARSEIRAKRKNPIEAQQLRDFVKAGVFTKAQVKPFEGAEDNGKSFVMWTAKHHAVTFAVTKEVIKPETPDGKVRYKQHTLQVRLPLILEEGSDARKTVRLDIPENTKVIVRAEFKTGLPAGMSDQWILKVQIPSMPEMGELYYRFHKPKDKLSEPSLRRLRLDPPHYIHAFRVRGRYKNPELSPMPVETFTLYGGQLSKTGRIRYDLGSDVDSAGHKRSTMLELSGLPAHHPISIAPSFDSQAKLWLLEISVNHPNYPQKLYYQFDRRKATGLVLYRVGDFKILTLRAKVRRTVNKVTMFEDFEQVLAYYEKLTAKDIPKIFNPDEKIRLVSFIRELEKQKKLKHAQQIVMDLAGYEFLQRHPWLKAIDQKFSGQKIKHFIHWYNKQPLEMLAKSKQPSEKTGLLYVALALKWAGKIEGNVNSFITRAILAQRALELKRPIKAEIKRIFARSAGKAPDAHTSDLQTLRTKAKQNRVFKGEKMGKSIGEQYFRALLGMAYVLYGKRVIRDLRSARSEVRLAAPSASTLGPQSARAEVRKTEQPDVLKRAVKDFLKFSNRDDRFASKTELIQTVAGLFWVAEKNSSDDETVSKWDPESWIEPGRLSSAARGQVVRKINQAKKILALAGQSKENAQKILILLSHEIIRQPVHSEYRESIYLLGGVLLKRLLLQSFDQGQGFDFSAVTLIFLDVLAEPEGSEALSYERRKWFVSLLREVALISDNNAQQIQNQVAKILDETGWYFFDAKTLQWIYEDVFVSLERQVDFSASIKAVIKRFPSTQLYHNQTTLKALAKILKITLSFSPANKQRFEQMLWEYVFKNPTEDDVLRVNQRLYYQDAKTVLAEKMPLFAQIVQDPKKTGRFLTVLSWLRLMYGFNEINRKPITSIAHAEKEGVYITIGDLEHGGFRIAPVSESFRRMIFYVPQKTAEPYAIELKYPGEAQDREMIYDTEFKLAREMWDQYGENSGVVKPVFFLRLRGAVAMYGKDYHFTTENPLGLAAVEYHEGKRVLNIFGQWSDVWEFKSFGAIEGYLEGIAQTRGMSVAQLKDRMAVDSVAGLIRIHALGYRGNRPSDRENNISGARDVHSENIRLVEKTGATVFVGDFNLFEKTTLTREQADEEISALLEFYPNAFVELRRLFPAVVKRVLEGVEEPAQAAVLLKQVGHDLSEIIKRNHRAMSFWQKTMKTRAVDLPEEKIAENSFGHRPDKRKVEKGLVHLLRILRRDLDQPALNLEDLTDDFYERVNERADQLHYILESKDMSDEVVQQHQHLTSALVAMFYITSHGGTYRGLNDLRKDWNNQPQRELSVSAYWNLAKLLVQTHVEEWFMEGLTEDVWMDLVDAFLEFTQVTTPDFGTTFVEPMNEFRWHWALALSVNGGRKALQLLERELWEKEKSEKDNGKASGKIAYQSILIEAIFLARESDLDDAKAKHKILWRAFRELKSITVRQLIKEMLRGSFDFDFTKRHSVRDYQILLYQRERYNAEHVGRRDFKLKDIRHIFTQGLTRADARSEVRAADSKNTVLFTDDQAALIEAGILKAITKVEESSLGGTVRQEVLTTLKAALSKAKQWDREGADRELRLARRMISSIRAKTIGHAREAILKLVEQIREMPLDPKQARSEVRKKQIQPGSQNRVDTARSSLMDIRDMTTPAAVFLDSGELARLTDNESEKRFEELLALLTQYKAMDIYLDGADRYPVESIKNKKFQQLLEEYSDRVHIGMFDRARLAQKKIVIQASLFGDDSSADVTAQRMERLKANYQIAGDVLPLEYTKPGALKAFLALSELGTAAELLHKISDFYVVRGANGRWQVAEIYLGDVWKNLVSSTAVAWSA